jgi:hypothetical protein
MDVAVAKDKYKEQWNRLYSLYRNGSFCIVTQSALNNKNIKNRIMTIEKTTRTTQDVANRFNELAREEKWFEIQDELFADNIRSIEPSGARHPNAEGKAAVRKKGEDWVKRITALYRASTSEPIVAGHHFAVARKVDIEVDGLGRIQGNEIMLYEVKDGAIVLEQFFY